MSVILKAENISKQYRLGTVGTGTLSHDLNRWWHAIRGKEDPYTKIGAVNNRASQVKEDYVWALRDINFEVHKGEVLGIIGKNGAGKSTLLKILSKVTGPTTGVIKTKGRIASLLEVGTGFHPELTGRENIFLNGAILGMTKAEVNSKLDEIIDFSGCALYIDTPVKRYSSGMRVRLAFAVAAHLEPEILVVDEVLAVGDAEFQKKAIGKMQDISRGEGRTVLFVSHNMAAVKNLCTRAILLENGKVKLKGEVSHIIESYLDVIPDKNDTTSKKMINSSDREGNNLATIKYVELIAEKNIPITGKSLSFVFYLDNPQKIALKDFRLDFRIDDQMGQRLLWFSTSIYKTNSDKVAEKISFMLDKLPLNAGHYLVTIQLIYKKQVVDWPKNAFSFMVEEGSFYENMQQVAINQTKVLTDFKIKY